MYGFFTGDGEMDYKEFLAGFGFDDSALIKKLFEAFDGDNSGKIDLMEFIQGLRNWQRFTWKEKMKFTYSIYDLDGSGYLEPCELAECMSDSNAGWRNKKRMQAVTRKILHFLEQAEINRIMLNDFEALAQKFPSTLFLPLFGLMERIFTMIEIHNDVKREEY